MDKESKPGEKDDNKREEKSEDNTSFSSPLVIVDGIASEPNKNVVWIDESIVIGKQGPKQLLVFSIRERTRSWIRGAVSIVLIQDAFVMSSLFYYEIFFPLVLVTGE